MGGKCEKILFIIRKTSESAYKDCLESITALKMPAGYIVKNAPYEILDVFSASDAYLDVCQAECPDISIILDDTVLLVYDNLLNEIADIFSADESIGLIGIKGAEEICFIQRKYQFKNVLFSKKYALLTIGIPTFNGRILRL